MGKSMEPAWGEFYGDDLTRDGEQGGDDHALHDHDLRDHELIEGQMLDDEEALSYLQDTAHEALERLSQRANRRGSLYRRPKRAESWQ